MSFGEGHVVDTTRCHTLRRAYEGVRGVRGARRWCAPYVANIPPKIDPLKPLQGVAAWLSAKSVGKKSEQRHQASKHVQPTRRDQAPCGFRPCAHQPPASTDDSRHRLPARRQHGALLSLQGHRPVRSLPRGRCCRAPPAAANLYSFAPVHLASITYRLSL